MAAAEYYNPGSQQPNGMHQASTSTQGPASLSPNPPYPLSDLPPPYTPFADQQSRPHSQPPPQQRPPPNDQYLPPPPNHPPPSNFQYPPDKNGRPPPPPPSSVHNMYKPSDFGPTNTAQPYQQPQGYVPLAGTPAMQQVYSQGPGNGRRPSTTPGYRPPHRDEARSRSRSRSRSHNRSRPRKHHHRPPPQQKKSSGVNTFLGAGGGAIIGDAIFPGLGTLGGALLGGIGGHEYSKNKTRSASNPSKNRRAYDDSYYDEYRRGRKY